LDRFVICTRNVTKGRFGSEPGKLRYLQVPPGAVPSPDHGVTQELWTKRLRAAATWGGVTKTGVRKRGDIVVFVHGYNNEIEVVMERHNQLTQDLADASYKGVIMSFDWPSADNALNYLEDRHDTKSTAVQLVVGGISVLSKEQTQDCIINIHLLAHSTGAYVIREAFDDADDSQLSNSGWTVSQAVFIAGDVSAASMAAGRDSSDSLYRHWTRLTNYSSRYDSALKLSNAKQLGNAPCVGRVGLPDDAPSHAVNVDCTHYFELLERDQAVRKEDQKFE